MIDKYEKLQEASLQIFNTASIASLLGLQRESAPTVIKRMLAKGFLIKLKRDTYILRQKMFDDLFLVANHLYQPSFVSGLSALNYWGISTQSGRDTWSVTSRQSKELVLADYDLSFVYRWLPGQYYFGYTQIDGVLIARPEKALLDCFYTAKGEIDFASLTINALNKEILAAYLQNYSVRFGQRFTKSMEGIWT